MSVNTRKQSVLLAVIAVTLVVAGLWWLLLSRDGRMPSRVDTSSRPPEAPPLSIIEHVAYRKTSEFDPGTIRVYLRNTTGRDMRFEKVLLDGLPIPVWGVDLTIESTAPSTEKEPEPKPGGDADEHKGVYESAAARFSGKRILWAKLSPASIPPGGIGEFSAKFVNPLPRPMKVEFVPKSGDTLSAVVRPVDPALRVTAITFAEDLKRVYIYMEGVLDHPLELLGLELNGEWIGVKPPEHDKVDSPALWLSSSNLVKDEKQLAVLNIPSPLTQGDYITLRTVYREGFTAEERVRVFSGFPLAMESGKPRQDLGLPGERYNRHNSYIVSTAPDRLPQIPPAPTLQGNLLYCCQMHKYGGDTRKCALVTLRRHFLLQRADPHHPNANHLCRVRPETGYALFAETADVLRINPNVLTGLSQPKESEPPEETVARITRYAILAARPRPVHSLADTARIDDRKKTASPEEFRRKTYTILGTGVKGLLYRHWSHSLVAEESLFEAARNLNQELAHLRSYLAIAEPVDWVEPTGREDVTTYSLLAGRDALVLILVRHGKAVSANQPAKSAADKPESDLPSHTDQTDQVGGASIRLRLRLPEWFAPGKVQAVASDGLKDLDGAVSADGESDLPLPETAAFLIRRAAP